MPSQYAVSFEQAHKEPLPRYALHPSLLDLLNFDLDFDDSTNKIRTGRLSEELRGRRGAPSHRRLATPEPACFDARSVISEESACLHDEASKRPSATKVDSQFSRESLQLLRVKGESSSRVVSGDELEVDSQGDVKSLQLRRFSDARPGPSQESAPKRRRLLRGWWKGKRLGVLLKV
jgi:hypothetical protein